MFSYVHITVPAPAAINGLRAALLAAHKQALPSAVLGENAAIDGENFLFKVSGKTEAELSSLTAAEMGPGTVVRTFGQNETDDAARIALTHSLAWTGPIPDLGA